MAQPSHFSISQVAAPEVEPVDVDYVKKWLRLDGDDFDDQLEVLIQAAREMCSDYTGRAFTNTQYLLKLDRPPLIPNSQYAPGNPNLLSPVLQNTWPLDPSVWAIRIPRSPLVTVDAFTYIDASTGAVTTLDPSQYQVDANSEPGRLTPVVGGYWPGVQWRPNSVSITFTAGYGASAAAVPAKFRHAIAVTVGAMFDNPNGGCDALPETARRILDNDRVEEVW